MALMYCISFVAVCGKRTSARINIMPFFFFNDTATTEIYTLSLHDALPIYGASQRMVVSLGKIEESIFHAPGGQSGHPRSEEHTSELQSQSNLVCRLLLEKKKPIL